LELIPATTLPIKLIVDAPEKIKLDRARALQFMGGAVNLQAASTLRTKGIT
jgi:hypothetical protein